jgi:prophage regulatory protein
LSQLSTALTADERRVGGRRLVGVSELQQQVPLSRVWIWKLVKTGRFPKPIKLPGGKINFWFQDEVDAWIDARAAARDSEETT